MALFTNDRYSFTSKLSQKEIFAVLKKNVRPKQAGIKRIFRKRGFEGDVENSSFSFSYTGKSRIVIIKGAYQGSDVEFTMGISSPIKIFYLVVVLLWLFFLSLLVVGNISSSSLSSQLFVILFLNLLVIAMQASYLKSDKKMALQKMSQILKAQQ
jgi:hypothetical protein